MLNRSKLIGGSFSESLTNIDKANDGWGGAEVRLI